jgi:hypothetical protein
LNRPFGKRTAFLLLSSAAVGVAPKCPLCLVALLGISGTTVAWLSPVTMLWIKIAAGVFALATFASVVWRGWLRDDCDRCSIRKGV